MNALFSQMKKSVASLTLFTVVCVFIVTGMHLITKDAIATQEKAMLLKTLHEVIPKQLVDNDLTQYGFTLPPTPELHTYRETQVYVGTHQGKVVAYAFTIIAPDGYNGNINLLIGIRPDGNILGVRTLKHRETPGLGDLIDIKKSDWISRFTGKSLTSPVSEKWSVKKDGGQFDQFTGATITPRAVVKAVKQALIFFEQNEATWKQHHE